MSKSEVVLVITISSEGVDSDYELHEGKKLILGRSPNCNHCLSAPNISAEHLEIYFVEGRVRIRDLSSANGTFRIPTKAPFVEAQFPLKSDDLQLLLAKSLIKVKWRVAGEVEANEIEKTIRLNEAPAALLAPEKEREAGPLPAIVPLSGPSPVDELKKVSRHITATREVSQVPGQLNSKRSEVQDDSYFVLVPFALAVLGTIVGVLLLNRQFISPLRQLKIESASLGAAWDQFIFWFWALEQQGWIFAVLIPGFFALGIWFLKDRGSLKAGERLIDYKRFVVTSILCTGVILSPWFFLIDDGVSPKLWPRLIGLTLSLEDPAVSTKEKHALLKTVLPEFKGSSYFYVKRFQVQTKRVVDECDGAGEKPWENKKVCLLLLHAVGVENLEDFAPVYLKDTAYRVSLVLSLDGLERVLSVEGKESRTIDYFLNSLSLVGLQTEKDQIHRVVFEKNLDAAQTRSILHDLRQGLEDKINQKNTGVLLPKFLQLELPLPIELGI